MELHLRQVDDDVIRSCFSAALTESEMDALLAAPNQVWWWSERTTILLDKAFSAGHVRGIRALVSLHSFLAAQNIAAEKLNSVQNTPEAWSYQKHMRFTIQLWLGILPIAMLPSLEWGTPVIASLIGWVVSWPLLAAAVWWLMCGRSAGF